VIASAGAQLFAERGYDGTSLEAIAEEAGISRAVVYDHFPSKAALHVALLDEQTEHLLGAVVDAVATAEPQPDAQLRVGVDAFFRYVEEHPFAWRMLFRDAPADPVVVEAHDRVQRRATTVIAALLHQGAVRAGAQPAPHDPRITAFAEMLKVAQNSLAGRWWDDRALEREQLVGWVLEFAWLGLEQALARAPRAGPARERDAVR